MEEVRKVMKVHNENQDERTRKNEQRRREHFAHWKSRRSSRHGDDAINLFRVAQDEKQTDGTYETQIWNCLESW
jgi:hypothetical protein